MSATNPTTPFRPLPARRILEPSPSFSNYFSDEDATSPLVATSSLTSNMDATPLQRRLLARLHEIGQQILRKDVEDHERVLSSELDALEETLSAPDPQTRTPAEVEDSGLFMDDEDDEEEESKSLEAELKAQEESEKASEHAEHDELNERLAQIVHDLQDRYEEVKHINRLAITRLEASENKVDELSAENEALREEMSQSDSDMLYLKMQLRALEVEAEPHLDTSAGADLRAGIKRWKEDWKAARNRSPKYARRQDSAIDGLGIDSTEEDVAAATGANGIHGSPTKSRLTITRPGLISQHSTDPFVDEDVPAANGTPRGGSDKAPVAITAEEVTSPREAAVKEFQIQHNHTGHSPEDSPRERLPAKTPWEELWEGLAALTGMQGD